MRAKAKDPAVREAALKSIEARRERFKENGKKGAAALKEGYRKKREVLRKVAEGCPITKEEEKYLDFGKKKNRKRTWEERTLKRDYSVPPILAKKGSHHTKHRNRDLIRLIARKGMKIKVMDDDDMRERDPREHDTRVDRDRPGSPSLFPSDNLPEEVCSDDGKFNPIAELERLAQEGNLDAKETAQILGKLIPVWRDRNRRGADLKIIVKQFRFEVARPLSQGNSVSENYDPYKALDDATA